MKKRLTRKQNKNNKNEFFAFNIADESHSKVGMTEQKDLEPEALLAELSESDEY